MLCDEQKCSARRCIADACIVCSAFAVLGFGTLSLNVFHVEQWGFARGERGHEAGLRPKASRAMQVQGSAWDALQCVPCLEALDTSGRRIGGVWAAKLEKLSVRRDACGIGCRCNAAVAGASVQGFGCSGD